MKNEKIIDDKSVIKKTNGMNHTHSKHSNTNNKNNKILDG